MPKNRPIVEKYTSNCREIHNCREVHQRLSRSTPAIIEKSISDCREVHQQFSRSPSVIVEKYTSDNQGVSTTCVSLVFIHNMLIYRECQKRSASKTVWDIFFEKLATEVNEVAAMPVASQIQWN
jgi:hypothetical protein